MSNQAPTQPLHPSIISKLDPEYVEFHQANLLYTSPTHTLPWDPAIRNNPTVPGGSVPLKVGSVRDFDLPHTKLRSFTPEGTAPAEGWPAFIFFHGGGWTLGNISSETSFSTNMCVLAKCVVLSIDYRLAPENPYPAGLIDAIDALDWAVQKGRAELNINTSKIAVGGSSSGGNLAAILALKAAESTPPIPLVFQLLVVPVTDNTASVEDRWAANQHTPWLSPARMLWFRGNYLPNKEDWTKWDASPIFAPGELLRKVPKAWIAIAEMDILADEGIAYGEMMKKEGVQVHVEVYKGAPHPIMAMDGRALTIGKLLVSDAAKALANAFGTA